MEFWVVAAATGAGYVAKHWQNLTGEKDSTSKLSPAQSPRVQRDACQWSNKTPNSVFPLPKLARRCLLDGDVSSSEDDNTDDEMNGKYDSFGNRLHEFRTKNSNRKSFSSLRPLVVTRNSIEYQRKQMAQVDDVKENGATLEAEFVEPTGSVTLPRRPEQMHAKRFETTDLHSQGTPFFDIF